MPDTYKKVLLQNPKNNNEKWLPQTIAEMVTMPDSSTLIQALAALMATDTYTEVVNNNRRIKPQYLDLAAYLLAGTNSVTTAPYVAEVSVNVAGDTLTVKTWAKESDGTLKTETIPIVGSDTRYSLSAKYNTETDPNETPNSAVRLTDSDGSNVDAKVPMGALVNDTGVRVILDGNWTEA